MVKAKDLLNKSQDSGESEETRDESFDKAQDEHEQVHEAYEDITKRLEAIRNGEDKDDEGEDSSSVKASEDKEDEVDPLDKDADLSEEEIEEKNAEEEVEDSGGAKASQNDNDEEEDVKTFGERDELSSLADKDEDKDVDAEDIEEFNERDESEEPKESGESKDQMKSEDKEETLDDLASESIDPDQIGIKKKEDVGSKGEYYSRLEAAEDTTHIPPLGGNPASTGERYAMNDYSIDGSEEAKPAYPSDYKSSINRYPLGGERPRKASKLHLLILILIGLAVIGGTVYLLKNQFSASPTPSPTPEVTSEPSPTPSPTPEAIERSKFKIRVLNGTTTSGLAKTVSEKLKGLGYQEDRVGNAPKQDFEVTEVKVKVSATGLADQLMKDLTPDYSASISAELKDTDTADAEVIIGKK